MIVLFFFFLSQIVSQSSQIVTCRKIYNERRCVKICRGWKLSLSVLLALGSRG